MKKSIIKKSITKKISTAPYESVDIHIELTETVEWETMDERMKKTDAISKILIIDFIKSLNQAAEELGFTKNIAQISGKKESQNAKEKTDDKSINTNKDEGNFDFDQL